MDRRRSPENRPSRGRTVFVDRRDAGRRLAPLVEHLRDDDPIVLALPRALRVVVDSAPGLLPVAALFADPVNPVGCIALSRIASSSHAFQQCVRFLQGNSFLE